MQANRLHSYKAIRLDDGITGADLSRPGFLAAINDARYDTSISHLLILRRDRFARPEDAIKMVAIEKDLRLAGVTFVFTDSDAEPLVRGQRLSGKISLENEGVASTGSDDDPAKSPESIAVR